MRLTKKGRPGKKPGLVNSIVGISGARLALPATEITIARRKIAPPAPGSTAYERA